MKYFTSDWHLGHKNVIKFCKRPFKDLEEMHHQLALRWNSKVTPYDIGYFLGDISFMGSEATREIISCLNGTKILIRGNHDPKHLACLNMGFDMVVDEMHIRERHEVFTLSHYPFDCDRFPDRRPVNHKQWLLHGHLHGGIKRPSKKSIDVGVDAWDFEPVSFNEILKIRRGG